MASAYYSNTQHIDFESVLAMDDPGMVSMFQALMASGLEGFLGCPAVIYEAALVDFFKNASVRDGVIISTVAGQLVEISEEWSIVSMSGEPVSLSGKKSQMKIEYRILCDIVAKSISVKAGCFNIITVEKFSILTVVVYGVRMNWASVLFNILKNMVTPGSKQAKGFVVQISLLLENIPNLELGESSEFPASKILTENTVHRYVSLNDKVGAEEDDGAPKPKAASKKRPATVLGDEPVVKKKRTMKKKSSSSKVNLEIVVVAQEALPIQMVEPTTAAPASEDIFAQPATVDEIPADPPSDEVAGETVDEEAADEGAYEETTDGEAARVNEPASKPAVADIVNEEPSTADDVDVIIEQVLADTSQIRGRSSCAYIGYDIGLIRFGSETVGLSNQVFELSGQIVTVENAIRAMVAANRKD
ncbi:dystroglycan-like [Dorcoceras hygrometricum]|uniref:Dystroglycan-like n=1 Tax=Dorcoceras hygrometricum TaxID=472368 RepID=A0A2Z7B2P7_9LAMI|nr:dystroglycan-like [Dorcoceras hygrometricum]